MNPFDPAYALNQILPLAEAAYDLSKLPPGWQLMSPIQPDNFGFIASADGVIVIAFRGTQTEGEWMEDFDALPVPNEYGEGAVHQGFQLQYKALRDSMVKVLKGSAEPLAITGHSLGAALATLCAADFNRIGWVRELYTWAGPRVGLDDFCTWMNPRVEKHYRIVNKWDPVPHLPPFVNGYRHAGSYIGIDGGETSDWHVAHSLEKSYRPGLEKLLPR